MLGHPIKAHYQVQFVTPAADMRYLRLVVTVRLGGADYEVFAPDDTPIGDGVLESGTIEYNIPYIGGAEAADYTTLNVQVVEKAVRRAQPPMVATRFHPPHPPPGGAHKSAHTGACSSCRSPASLASASTMCSPQ